MSRSAAPGGGILLAAVVVPVVLCGLPCVGVELITMMMNFNGPEFTHYVLPALVGWPVALILWQAARRVTNAPAAWLLIAVAAVLLIAVTIEPVRVGLLLWHGEWLETQPGGRGYQGPR
jgi:hypothetical protein